MGGPQSRVTTWPCQGPLPLEASSLGEGCTMVESSLFSSDLVHTSWGLHIHPKGVSVEV